jgi:hypothetical protein
MDSQSGFLIFASIVGFVLLIIVLVALLYKPAKKAAVRCNYLAPNEDNNHRLIQIHVKNTGKKPLKIVSPYISFFSLRTSENFQLKPESIKIMFPRILNVNEEMKCEAEIGHYEEYLSKTAARPSQIKVIIKDTEGLEFNSNAVDFKPIESLQISE